MWDADGNEYIDYHAAFAPYILGHADPDVNRAALGARMEKELEGIFKTLGIEAAISRQGSAFCAYFMDHSPKDWHDLAEHHDFEFDLRYRRALVQERVYHLPVATKQGSISLAHTDADIDETLGRTWIALKKTLK